MTRTSRRPARVARVVVAIVAVGAAVLGAGTLPAGAHAQIDSPASAVVNTDQTLNMYVPHERDESFFNREIKIKVASGWTNPACVAKEGWTCSSSGEGGAVVHYVKSGTSVMVDNENFAFTVHSPATEATWAFPTIQVYDDGETADWIGAAGSPNPAPTIRTIPAGTAPPTTPTPTTTPHDPIPTTTPVSPGPAPADPPTGGVDPSGNPTATPPPGASAATTAPGATTSTTVAGDPDADGTDETTPALAGSATTPGSAPDGRNPLLSEDAETASGITASEDSGSAVPVIAGGAVVLALLAVGGGLAVRRRAPATVAGDEAPGVEVSATDPTSEP